MEKPDELGLGRHDRIAVVLPNGPEMAVAFLAVAAGATCVPLNPACGMSEFDLYFTGLHAQAVIVQAGMDSPARAMAHAHGLQIIELSPVLEASAAPYKSWWQPNVSRSATAGPSNHSGCLRPPGSPL